MLEMLIDLAAFVLKSVTVLVVMVIFIAFFFALSRKDRPEGDGSYEITDLRDEQTSRRHLMETALTKHQPGGKKQVKERAKAMKQAFKKAEEALEAERAKLPEDAPGNLFVLDFKGGVRCTEAAKLEKEIDAVLDIAQAGDEVVLRLESPGGEVTGYGLCAAQLMRLRERSLRLVVCVDKVAASGGYMMACVASTIVAAPFAYIGSVGVVAALPNFHRLMGRWDIDYEQITAGRYKRTVTPFAEVTEEGRAKLKEQLEDIHKRFKEEIATYRPGLDIESHATGEYWLATDAKERGFVDEIATSAEYLRRRLPQIRSCALKIEWKSAERKTLAARLAKFFSAASWLKAARRHLADDDQVRSIRIS